MTRRDDLVRLVEQLPDEDLADAVDLMRSLRDQERRLAELAVERDAETDAWHRSAIAEAVALADSPES